MKKVFRTPVFTGIALLSGITLIAQVDNGLAAKQTTTTTTTTQTYNAATNTNESTKSSEAPGLPKRKLTENDIVPIIEVEEIETPAPNTVAQEVAPQTKVPVSLPDVQAKTFMAPTTKFNLSQWSLSVPSDKDGNGKADQIKETELRGFANEYFYLNENGGMVFTCPIKGAKTSANTSYTRSELREMLRAGDKSIKTKGVTKNNWVLQCSRSVKDAGGYNGHLKATLEVNHVTTTGKENQVGRVIIGQIHAEHNEPIRVYYRKLPNNENGSIYFAHEWRDKDKEDWHELIGSKSSKAANPKDGIPLGEKFTYEILVIDTHMNVRITKADGTVIQKGVDFKKSGYDAKEEYMYFKAGVYNQNKTGEPNDYVQATFYELSNKHQDISTVNQMRYGYNTEDE